ncbi:acetyltransferase [Kocuria rosea]|uniref:acetyltransferase n=1 Tax=Kocuria rosea TaxID=1275 RepID=UPI000F6DF75E|nr:acetyltransferase [Kocuria rosea]VEI50359.1 Galactoside O-acetyltransferase [Kocuria rosea]
MASPEQTDHDSNHIPVIDLSAAPGQGEAWTKGKWMIYLWSATELVLVTNPWQVSSSLRTMALRAFGAQIGEGVIVRPRTRIKFPWNLRIGDRAWIGEGVWIHNQDQVTIGHDAVVSQETFITTGSHAHRTDMGLITRPVVIREGAWITARCVITGGVVVGRSALVQPLTRVAEDVPGNAVYGHSAAFVQGDRFRTRLQKDNDR